MADGKAAWLAARRAEQKVAMRVVQWAVHSVVQWDERKAESLAALTVALTVAPSVVQMAVNWVKL